MKTLAAQAAGIPVASYRRLERGQRSAPPLWQLANCALALGVDVTDLLEASWLRWHPPDPARPNPPDPHEFWRRPPDSAE